MQAKRARRELALQRQLEAKQAHEAFEQLKLEHAGVLTAKTSLEEELLAVQETMKKQQEQLTELKKVKLPIEIEVETVAEFKKVIMHKPDIILLDNFNIFQIKKAVIFRNKNYPKIKLEASGGITLKNIKDIAKAGVDYVSVGAITHSFQSMDFSLEIENE